MRHLLVVVAAMVIIPPPYRQIPVFSVSMSHPALQKSCPVNDGSAAVGGVGVSTLPSCVPSVSCSSSTKDRSWGIGGHPLESWPQFSVCFWWEWFLVKTTTTTMKVDSFSWDSPQSCDQGRCSFEVMLLLLRLPDRRPHRPDLDSCSQLVQPLLLGCPSSDDGCCR